MAIKEFPSSTAVIPAQSGNSGKYLTTNGSTVSWGSPSGMTLLASGNIGTTSTTGLDITGIPSDYVDLVLYVSNLSQLVGASTVRFITNNNTLTDYAYQTRSTTATTITNTTANGSFVVSTSASASTVGLSCSIFVKNYADSTTHKYITAMASDAAGTIIFTEGVNSTLSAINRVTLYLSSGTFDSGTYKLYGVK